VSRLVLFGRSVVVPGSKPLSNVFIEIEDGLVAKLTSFGRDPDISADVILPGIIDAHVHCRDWGQSRKETLATASAAAVAGGIVQVHDMPNTDPPILLESDVERRLSDAEKAGMKARYKVYVGITEDAGQVGAAAECASKNPGVAGLKLFAGDSFGSLGITDPRKQARVYGRLARSGYSGVLMVHCEKLSEFAQKAFDEAHPESWSEIRPAQSETESVKDQISAAAKAGFRGHLHICHVTLPETVRIVSAAPSKLRVSCGVTPHHLLLSTEQMATMKSGSLLKVNPPLREKRHSDMLIRKLGDGGIAWLESDHAPHCLEEKLSLPFASGVPELDTYSGFVTSLYQGYGMPWQRIAEVTSQNAARVFGLGPRSISPGSVADLTLIDMKPSDVRKESLRTKCGWSPYEGMAFPGRCKATVISGNVAYASEEH